MTQLPDAGNVNGNMIYDLNQVMTGRSIGKFES